jgi:thymidylate synthase
MNNEEIIYDNCIIPLYNKFNNNEFVKIHNTNTVELVNISMELHPNFAVNFENKKTNIKYCKKELNWYLSESLSIENYVDDITIWRNISSKFNEVNSNYGWCIFSDKNNSQYDECLSTLYSDKNSRRAIMMYNRPSMQQEYNTDGMSDFICTINTQALIRNNTLIYIVNMRSNDFIYGFFNDFYWHCYSYI